MIMNIYKIHILWDFITPLSGKNWSKHFNQTYPNHSSVRLTTSTWF